MWVLGPSGRRGPGLRRFRSQGRPSAPGGRRKSSAFPFQSSVTAVVVSTRWYLGCLKESLGGAVTIPVSFGYISGYMILLEGSSDLVKYL